jgi:ABC-type lipoprotein release transport system permease subunit
MKLAGHDHLSAGVDPEQLHVLTGGRRPELPGRVFDPNNAFALWLEGRLQQTDETDPDTVVRISNEELGEQGGLELVIDSRLARQGGFKVGDTVEAANCRWRIVGIVPEGGMARIYMPRRTAQFLFGGGSLTRSTVMFVKIPAHLDPAEAARQMKNIRWEIVQVRQYRNMLQQRFGIMYVYVDAVNAIAMIIAFLFIMVTLYTMVLQRTREIAILKSFGATRAYILRQVLAESMLLTAAGTAVGLAVSFFAGWLIQSLSLYTVSITWHWVAVAIGAAALGATVAGLYPAWQAMRVDMMQALTLE